MTPSRPRFDLPPRGLTRTETAGYLGHGVSWLSNDRLEKLYSLGFPRPDSVTERTDRVAIDVWLNQRSSLTSDQGYDGGLGRRLKEFGNGAAT